MTEEGWRFLLDEWSRYKRQTGVVAQQLLDELWGCMTEDLRQLAFAEGGSVELATEADMLARIKKLAVVTLHPSVHIVSLHELRQQSDENTQTFAAKVRGIAGSCGLTKLCSGCQATVSFSEETCYHQVLSGISDQSMKERALTQAMMGTIKDLDSLVKWCTADEAGRLGTPGMTVGRLRQSTLKQQKYKKCRNCGAAVHGDNGRAAREKDCKAFGKTCSKCQKKDHFASVCKSAVVSKTSAITEEDTQATGTNNSLSFFAIQRTPPKPELWRPWLPTPPRQSPPVLQYSVPIKNRFTLLYKPDPNLSPPEEPLNLADKSSQLGADGKFKTRRNVSTHLADGKYKTGADEESRREQDAWRLVYLAKLLEQRGDLHYNLRETS